MYFLTNFIIIPALRDFEYRNAHAQLISRGLIMKMASDIRSNLCSS